MENPVCWLQLSAGQGPRECGWVVAQVLRRLLDDARALNVTVEIVESVAHEKRLRNQDFLEPDAYASVLLRLSGRKAENICDAWVGTLQWKGESPFRPRNPRCNWFVGVVRLDAQDTAGSECPDLDQLMCECDLDTMRSGGPGGQHVNKTSSAVRLVHRPSGLSVRVESARSQHRNKKLALERLQLLLQKASKEQEKSDRAERREHHYQLERGNARKIFYGPEFRER